MLQFHITFTLASVTLCSHAVAFIGQQEPLTLLHYVFFFAQILLTCDPRVTNASTCERIRGTFQTSLYRQGKRGVGAKGWSVKFRLSLGDFLYDLSNVESYSLCSDPLVSL